MAQAHVLGVDFGTSNSAAGYLRDGKPALVQWPNGQTTLPTTFFFDFDTKETLIGEPANLALLDGADGRFMRALKRVLGTSLMHEPRTIFRERLTFVQIIGRFLALIKQQAEAQSGQQFDRALSGRPVVFHGSDAQREAKAEADLRACYLEAGFSGVEFMPEPVAAAWASGAGEHDGEIGLIVDIGGGTSDFSLFRAGQQGISILANHGVRIGGTDFDRAINIHRVMPLLGRGTQLKKMFGTGTTPTPPAIFNDLATWEKIPFLYTAQNKRMAKEMAQQAQEPAKLNRLVNVLERELGHELAFAVERGKIAANSGDDTANVSLDLIEDGLTAGLSPRALIQILSQYAAALHDGAQRTLEIADLGTAQVDRIIYVGGSSLMSIVPDSMKALFPSAQHEFSEVFTAVTDGLAIASERT